jgi:hypothetical protein
MKTLTLAEYYAELKAQGVAQIEDAAFICPMCQTIQSARDLIAAGAGKNLDEVEKYLAYSCVGRFTGAPSPRRKPDGKPCNWTLGGLFQLHEMEVITLDGEHHPRFMLATPEQAQAHAADRVLIPDL